MGWAEEYQEARQSELEREWSEIRALARRCQDTAWWLRDPDPSAAREALAELCQRIELAPIQAGTRATKALARRLTDGS